MDDLCFFNPNNVIHAHAQITRGEDLQSVSLPGLYPTGEGAGYAGGIVSAAVDGLRVGDALVSELLGLAVSAEDRAAASAALPKMTY